jgi:hypothetical protein
VQEIFLKAWNALDEFEGRALVMRGFTGAPTFTPAALRAIAYDPSTAAPICFDPRAVKTVLPYYELRTHLGIQGKTPEQIAELVKQAYDNGTLPKASTRLSTLPRVWSVCGIGLSLHGRSFSQHGVRID